MTGYTNEPLCSAIGRLANELPRIREAAERLEIDSAPRFSAFEALPPNEIRLSAALAYLLDPKETHGQQGTLLNRFLDLIDRPNLRNTLVQVTKENPTEHGRYIDIVLEFEDYLIGIENKPRAAESESQCGDYLCDLEKRKPGRALLVFLTHDGRPPRSAGDVAARVRSFAYSDLVSAWQECRSAARVTDFLDQFHQYVRVQMLGEARAMSRADGEILNCLLQPENINAALEVVTLASEIRGRFITSFSNALLSKILGDFATDWKYYPERDRHRKPDWDNKDSGLYLYRPAWLEKYGICFSNVEPNGGKVIFGVNLWKRPGRHERVRERVREALRTVLGEGEPGPPPDRNGTDQWFWHRYMSDEYANWHSRKVLEAMALKGSEQAVRELYPFVRDAIRAVGPILDEAASGSA